MPESKRFLLRLDPRLFEAMRRWADDELRSINGQIEYLLTEQARRAGRLPHHHAPAPPAPPAERARPEGDEDEDPDGAGAAPGWAALGSGPTE